MTERSPHFQNSRNAKKKRKKKRRPAAPMVPMAPRIEFYDHYTMWQAYVDNADVACASIRGISLEEARSYIAKHPEVIIGPERYYNETLSEIDRLTLPQKLGAVLDESWYRSAQPQYLAYPGIVAALGASSIDIESQHLMLPYPSIAIRLPVGFLISDSGVPIRSVTAGIIKNERRGVRPALSLSGPLPPISRLTPGIRINNDGERVVAVFVVIATYIKEDGEPAMTYVSIGLREGETLEDAFDRMTFTEETGAPFAASMMRQLIALSVGISFLAIGRTRVERRHVVVPGGQSRQARRRFEREYGEEQPSFEVGRELVIPREAGAPTAEEGPGEGAGRELRFAHYKTGYVRYQWVGSKSGKEPSNPWRREIRFLPPTIVRPDRPLRPVTPSRVTPPRGPTETR